jgi:glycosyltransferase involved in cell wall biosynthesis
MKRMSIYANPHLRSSGSYFGYAYTFNEISKYLRQTKIDGEKLQVDLNSPKSKIQLCYGTPPGFFYDHQYKIQMTQWESTMVPPSWVDLAKGYNEYWTANEFGRDAFLRSGVPEEKLHIFEHGVDADTWTPKKRERGNVIRFLHVDSGSPRKRADIVKTAFNAAFGGNMDYELTLKHSHSPVSGVDWTDNDVLENRGEWETANIRHIRENMSLPGLVSLFHFHDVLVYPSEGEGFGLIPLQALATGMPVISTSRWCSYEEFLNENIIESTFGVSDTVESYTRYGEVVLPSVESTVHLMENIVDNFEEQSLVFYGQVNEVTKKYDWLTLSETAMLNLHKRMGSSMFTSYTGYLK